MKIIGLGDSIMAFNNHTTYPQAGWLQKMNLYLNPIYEISIVDLGQNGRSTKSYIDEGWFDKVYKIARWGDLAIISFGHNDEKEDVKRHTEPFETYLNNLDYMIKRLESKGTDVVLITSWPRLSYDEKGQVVNTHHEYPKAMLQYAREHNLKCIDLNTIGIDYLNEIGKEKASEMFMILPSGKYKNYPEGKDDHSHLNDYGAYQVCGLVVDELKKFKDLTRYFE